MVGKIEVKVFVNNFDYILNCCRMEVFMDEILTDERKIWRICKYNTLDLKF